jgi:hypothetical protein
MLKYKRETARISVKFIDAKTENVIFEVPDRNHMNVGEILTETYGNALLQKELKERNLKFPQRVLVLTVSELILTDE